MRHPLIPSNSSSFYNVIEKQLINQTTVQTIYKIKEGGFIRVTSCFDEEKTFKDAIFPAALESAQQELHA